MNPYVKAFFWLLCTSVLSLLSLAVLASQQVFVHRSAANQGNFFTDGSALYFAIGLGGGIVIDFLFDYHKDPLDVVVVKTHLGFVMGLAIAITVLAFSLSPAPKEAGALLTGAQIAILIISGIYAVAMKGKVYKLQV